jgi:acyl carrier protein
MTIEEITLALTSIFRKTFGDETLVLSDDMTANDVDNWDSLSHMLMITEIEDHFSIKFKLRELNKLKNVGILIDLINTKIS